MPPPDGYYLILDELTAPDGYRAGDYARVPGLWAAVWQAQRERQQELIAAIPKPIIYYPGQRPARMDQRMGQSPTSSPHPQKS